MFDPGERVMRPVPEDESTLTSAQRTWTRFQEGEELTVKGIKMRVHEIGESRMVLKFVVLLLLLAVPAFAQQKTAPTPTPAAAAKEPTVAELKKQLADKDYQIAQLSLQIAVLGPFIL